MANIQVKSYRLGWDPGDNKGRASIELTDGRKREMPINSAAELAAISTVLKEAPVFLGSNGMLYSGWEPID